jgi:hypothetical protein
MRSRAALIGSALRQCQIPVRRILDAGCGIGLLQKPFKEFLPRARYLGLESSEYLCNRFGWTLGSIVDYAARRPYDLVICYDVLQYLPDAQAARAIVNLGRLSGAALYVSALTTEDWRENCDRSRTDRAVHLRSGAWYRRRLNKWFRDTLGDGAPLSRRGLGYRLSRIQAASAACSGSAAPKSARTLLTNDTSTKVLPEAAVT